MCLIRSCLPQVVSTDRVCRQYQNETCQHRCNAARPGSNEDEKGGIQVDIVYTRLVPCPCKLKILEGNIVVGDAIAEDETEEQPSEKQHRDCDDHESKSDI